MKKRGQSRLSGPGASGSTIFRGLPIPRAQRAPKLRFDCPAESVRSIEPLALQVHTDGVGFFRRDGLHDEGPVAALAFFVG